MNYNDMTYFYEKLTVNRINRQKEYWVEREQEIVRLSMPASSGAKRDLSIQ